MRNEMKIFDDVEKIAQLNTVYENLVLKLEEELDAEGIDWRTAVIVSGMRTDGEYLYDENAAVVAENCESDYFISACDEIMPGRYVGNLYYRTSVEDQYVRVNYEI